MKTTFITLLLVLGFCISIIAQTNNEQARQKYQEAKESYENKDYGKAIQLLHETKGLLGKDNIRIQSLLIRALSKAPAWQSVPDEVNIYLSLNPDTSMVDYIELMEIANKADVFIRKENEFFKTLEQKPTIKECEGYLRDYPFGKYKDEVQWLIAKTTHTMDSYYTYIDAYPQGKYFKEAKTILEYSDEMAYDKAIKEGTQSSLSNYLNNYPRGNYRSEISIKREERVEFDTYNDARGGNLEDYIAKYPKGKYSNEINRLLDSLYWNNGNMNYKSKDYYAAQSFFQKYIERFPNGMNFNKAKQKYNSCVRILSRDGIDAIVFTYDGEKAFGFGYEELKINKVGYYFQFRCNSDWFAELSSTYTINNAGVSDDLFDVVRTGNQKNGVIAVSGGLTFNIMYPIWLHIGVGIASYPVFEEVTEYSTIEDIVWLKNTDKSKNGVFPQIGLNLKLSRGLEINYSTIYHSEIFHQFGIGFKI